MKKGRQGYEVPQSPWSSTPGEVGSPPYCLELSWLVLAWMGTWVGWGKALLPGRTQAAKTRGCLSRGEGYLQFTEMGKPSPQEKPSGSLLLLSGDLVEFGHYASSLGYCKDNSLSV